MVDFENYRLSDYLANRLDNLKGTSPIAPGKGSLPNEVRQSLIGATDHQFRFADGYDKGIQLFTQLLEEFYRAFGCEVVISKGVGAHKTIGVFRKGHSLPDAMGTLSVMDNLAHVTVRVTHGSNLLVRDN